MQTMKISGGHLAYDDYDFTDPWSEAEPVVLVHGFSKNRLFWYGWIPDLARRYRVLRVDQRGHADSSLPPRDFEMGLRPFADDLVALLDGLGLASAHFVMAEFTSSVAVELAATYPDRVRSLVLPGFGYNWKASSVDWDGWSTMAETQGSLAWARATNHYRLHADDDAELREWYITQQARTPGWLLAKVFRFAKTVDLTPRLPQVRVPTLVLTGSESRQDTVPSIQKGVRSMPNAKLVMLEGAPFNVMSARTDDCVQETLRFLEEQKTA